MKRNVPSHSAELAAMTRAVAMHCRRVSQVMRDEYAHLFVGPSVIVPYVFNMIKLKCFGARAWERGMLAIGYLFALCRHRYMHDFITRAVQDGCSQVVILGAGYDTLGLLDDQRLKECRIFEVDHPATQNRKRRIIKKRGIPVPDTIRFVSCDLVNDDLASELARVNFDKTRQTCVIAEGLLSYFYSEKIEEILREIALLAEKVAIAADYRCPMIKQANRGSLISRWRESFRRTHEEYHTFLDSSDAERTFAQAGFSLLRQVCLTELNIGAKGFINLADDLKGLSEVYIGISDNTKKQEYNIEGQTKEIRKRQANKSICAIVNGKKRGSRLKILSDDLVRSGIDVLHTEHAGHATLLAKEALNYSTILAIGGDGTVHEIINGMDLEKQTLGIVSAGTVNCLARNWGLKRKHLTRNGISLLEKERVDVLQCTFYKGSRKKYQRYVLAFLAIGHEAQVASLAQKLGKKRLKIHYPIANILSTLLLPCHRAIISINKNSPITMRATSILLSNADSSLFSSINNWRLDDGTFELQIAKRNIVTQLSHNLRILIPFDIGTSYQSGVTTCDITLEQPTSVMVDGELLADISELHIEMKSKALHLFRDDRTRFSRHV